MKKLLILIITIIFITYISSIILVETSWLDKYYSISTLKQKIQMSTISFYSLTLLLFFLIANARYNIDRNIKIKRKKIQLAFGILLSLLLILNLLASHKLFLRLNKLEHESYKNDYLVSIQNQSHLAYKLYDKYGISIEYFDFNQTKQKFIPTKEQIQIRNNFTVINQEKEYIPYKITYIFTSMILAFYLGLFFSRREEKIK